MQNVSDVMPVCVGYSTRSLTVDKNWILGHKKVPTITFVRIFAKCWPILNIFLPAHSVENLQ